MVLLACALHPKRSNLYLLLEDVPTKAVGLRVALAKKCRNQTDDKSTDLLCNVPWLKQRSLQSHLPRVQVANLRLLLVVFVLVLRALSLQTLVQVAIVDGILTTLVFCGSCLSTIAVV